MNVEHIIYRVVHRTRTISFRYQILRELFLEEKRFLLEVLGTSKKKSVKDIVKKLPVIDLPGGMLDKALKYYFDRLVANYNDRFNNWRMTNFPNGGFNNIPMASKLVKDPIIESINKGTDVVEEEKTAEKSYERRQEKRKQEIADIAAARKTMGQKHKQMNKQNSSNAFHIQKRGIKAGIEGVSPGRDGDSEDETERKKYPPPPVFNSLPPSLEFVHRLLIKCTDPKFMEEKKSKKKGDK
jgi:hypothetical protein